MKWKEKEATILLIVHILYLNGKIYKFFLKNEKKKKKVCTLSALLIRLI